MLVRLDQDNEVYSVTIGDTYLGAMIQDDNAEFGWRTDDHLLLEELPDLSMALKEQEAIGNLPFALTEMYPNDLIGWEWNEDETMKLIAHPETDLTEFADVIRDQVDEVVLFEKDLIILLGKEGSSDIEEIHINC